MFGGVSIGVEKQRQIMVVRQNILSTVMLKNDKLFSGSVRWYLATQEIYQARNSSINPRILFNFGRWNLNRDFGVEKNILFLGVVYYFVV